MAKVMLSGKVDSELFDWATEYAAQRGVSRSALLEGALRDLQASAMGGAPDLGPESKPAAVTPLVRPAANVHRLGRGPRRIDSPADAKAWAWERQQRLNKPKGL